MKTKKILNHKVQAVTLTELLVVMVIMGILVLLALPNLMPLITKTHKKEAELQLSHVKTLQKTYFMQYAKYSDDLTKIDFQQEKLVTDGGNAKYEISLEGVSTTTFTAKATAVSDFDGDGIFNVLTIDQDGNITEVTPD